MQHPLAALTGAVSGCCYTVMPYRRDTAITVAEHAPGPGVCHVPFVTLNWPDRGGIPGGPLLARMAREGRRAGRARPLGARTGREDGKPGSGPAAGEPRPRARSGQRPLSRQPRTAHAVRPARTRTLSTSGMSRPHRCPGDGCSEPGHPGPRTRASRTSPSRPGRTQTSPAVPQTTRARRPAPTPTHPGRPGHCHVPTAPPPAPCNPAYPDPAPASIPPPHTKNSSSPA